MSARRWAIKLDGAAFGDGVACLGGQLAAVVRAVAAVCPGLEWYAADVESAGAQDLARRGPDPAAAGDSSALIAKAVRVDQFVSGVFAGVPRGIETPRFRPGGLWTEDEDTADLYDSVVEVRAFDTCYFLITSNDEALREHLLATDFGAAPDR